MKYWQNIIYRFIFLILPVATVLCLIAAFAWHQHLESFSPIVKIHKQESTVATGRVINLPTLPVATVPIYLQNDLRWKNDKIGGSQQTLGAVGCTVCCVSMALAHHGIDLPPNLLNELLKANDGYTQRGWLKWNTVSKITNSRDWNNQIRFYIPNKPSTTIIDAALQAGEPVIAKILLNDRIYHWVLIVGKEGNDYLVKDSLGDGQSLDKLSKFKSKIYAIRVVKKKL